MQSNIFKIKEQNKLAQHSEVFF